MALNNIVILGAGDVGRYVASILSKEEYNILLVDRDAKKLEEVSWNLDVATRQGLGTDWQLFDDLLEIEPQLFIALTDEDETNLVSCSITKHLGYPRTLARVRDSRFLNRARLDFSQIFEVDNFFSPELLVANDILKYMLSPGSLALENFAHGALQLRTLRVPKSWRKSDVALKTLDIPEGLMIGLIHRPEGQGKYRVIFPHGEDTLRPGDDVTFVGQTDTIATAHEYLGLSIERVKSVVIVGGSLTGLNLARLLEQRGIHATLLEKDYERCCTLADLLPKSTIVHHDGTDLDFLVSEKLERSDVFVSCTHSDDVNLLAALVAKEIGFENVVVLLTNMSYAPFLKKLGIHHSVSPRISAANYILSKILSGTVSELVSMYDHQVEVMEVNVSLNSKIVGIPLSELGPYLPKDMLIAMIQNRGRIMIANGNRVISPGDTIIVITNPKHVPEIEKYF